MPKFESRFAIGDKVKVVGLSAGIGKVMAVKFHFIKITYFVQLAIGGKELEIDSGLVNPV